jgi:uncharacterized protein (UPF0147 family)
MLAAELGGDLVVINDALANLLTGIVSNPAEPEQLRAKAAIALGPVLEQTDIDQFDDTFEEPPISEETFDRIQSTLENVYKDDSAPKLVRRRALEASVRAENDWHADAIRAAYARPDEEWKLTAVFAMQYVQGFDKEIVEALDNRNADIHFQAVRAAGTKEVAAAWPHVKKLMNSETTAKRLRLAAIHAAGAINMKEAEPKLHELADSEDEEIAEAADEALMMANPYAGDDEDEEDEFEGGGLVN